eukprot:scaffold7328_cov314-Pinguiococcus_pyrenoidosus.AAC.41
MPLPKPSAPASPPLANAESLRDDSSGFCLLHAKSSRSVSEVLAPSPLFRRNLWPVSMPSLCSVKYLAPKGMFVP